MLEICFSSSLQGSLKAFGGNVGTILYPCFGLSYGDISDPFCKETRKQAFDIQQYGNSIDAFENKWQEVSKDLSDLTSHCEEQVIRFWVDPTADSICGFLFLADVLRDKKIDAKLMWLPAWITLQDAMELPKEWGEVVLTEKLSALLDKEIKVPKLYMEYLSDEWRRLQQDHALLRATINGSICSVPDDFYDHFIKAVIKDEPIKIGLCMFQVVSNIQISDFIIYERIKHMLMSKELLMIEENIEAPLESVIQKA